jgi:hypothetical protein
LLKAKKEEECLKEGSATSRHLGSNLEKEFEDSCSFVEGPLPSFLVFLSLYGQAIMWALNLVPYLRNVEVATTVHVLKHTLQPSNFVNITGP